MRIYISGVQHESSSFSPIPTSFRSFEQWNWTADKPNGADGFGYGEACRLAAASDMEVVAGPFFNAEPSSPATSTAWRQISEQILDGLRAAMPVHVVLLCLHGAQMAESIDDCEGALLGAARAIIGPGVALGVLLDLHANVTSAMCSHADLTVSCREYPHIDYAERAAEMLPVLRGVAEGVIRPVTRAHSIPASGVFPTPDEPMRSFVIRITDAQRRPGVLMVSANHGFEGSDTPFTGASVVVTTDNDEALAEQMANEVATDFLATIIGNTWSGLGVNEAIDEALRQPVGPVVIADRSDNAGAGAASDSTYILAELIARGVTNAALGMIWDPMAVRACHDAGVAARLTLRIGGKAGRLSGTPVDADVEVTSVRDDAMQALFGRGPPREPLGKSAAVRIGDIDVVLTSRRQQVFSPHCFTEHGIDPAQRHIVVVKSMQHFMGGFAPIAACIVRCDGPGSATLDMKQIPYRRIRRPMLGLDPVETIALESLR
ncbi:MAG: M81 family metallopeptidase [Actinomycetota bacterium]|nr:M81 family metallopeptidase [Actinomycetota bacterium]